MNAQALSDFDHLVFEQIVPIATTFAREHRMPQMVGLLSVSLALAAVLQQSGIDRNQLLPMFKAAMTPEELH